MTHRSRILCFLFFVAVGCGETCDPNQINEDAIKCISDAQCSDDLYCNGIEYCDPDDPTASGFGCVSSSPCGSAKRYPDGTVECTRPEQEEAIAACFADGETFQTCCNQECLVDSDCDDGLFCNGEETCSFGGHCESGSSPCTSTDCLEVVDVCQCEDADDDGHFTDECGPVGFGPGSRSGGDDCNDNDGSIFPGNAEVCDEDGVDEDCDPTTLGPDVDGDGFAPLECCNGADCGVDCDDNLRGVNPGAVEVCNGLDDDCDGDIDEDLRQTFYVDTDGDGFGDASSTQVGCFDTIGSGYSLVAGDCDDTNPHIFPGSIVCNPGPNDPNRYDFCEEDGTYSEGRCDTLTQVCVTQPGGHGVCADS